MVRAPSGSSSDADEDDVEEDDEDNARRCATIRRARSSRSLPPPLIFSVPSIRRNSSMTFTLALNTARNLAIVVSSSCV